MKKIKIIERPDIFTVIVKREEVEPPENLSPEQIAELETQGDIMAAQIIQKYQKDTFYRIIEE